MGSKFTLSAMVAAACFSSAVSAQGQTQPSASINPITSAAVQMGALTCGARIEQVTNYLGVTADTRAMIHPPQGAPDTVGIGLAMTVTTDGVTGLATADFFPFAGGCVANYTLVTNFEDSCDAVRARTLSEDAAGTQLGDSATAYNGPNSVRLYFIDRPSGCTVTKIETVR
jgi:hypothetical protein